MDNKLYIGQNNTNPIYYLPDKNINGHILITGKSGSGKTSAIKNILNQLSQTDALLYALDFSKSLELKPTDFSNLDILLDFSITKPFSTHYNGNNASQTLLQKADIISSVWKLGSTQRTCIIKALLAMQSIFLKNSMILNSNNSFLPYMKASTNLPEPDFALLSYLLEEINTTTSINLSEKFIDIILHVYSDNVLSQKILPLDHRRHIIYNYPSSNCEINKKLTELFLWNIWIIRSNNYDISMPPIYIILDECQQLSFNDNTIMKKLLTEGRKFGFNLILSTQSLFYGFDKAAQSSLMQCGLRLIFNPPEAELSLTAKSIEQSNWKEWHDILRNLSVGESIAVGFFSSLRNNAFQKIRLKTPRAIKEVNHVQ
ncbi:hypothetical protein [Robinsoniella sp. KNHs210]|uniref:hypothetical protein n=1 Tax=Robinsoniella sp. KNHs210 TaxID=1469950 RepID=UPI0004898C0E|nr:hypothetical protein [Robinsoniella sp. KNHs210]